MIVNQNARGSAGLILRRKRISPTDRLYETFHGIFLFSDALHAGSQYVLGNPPGNLPDYAWTACHQFPFYVGLPLGDYLLRNVQGRRMPMFTLLITDRTEAPNRPRFNAKNYAVLVHLFGPAFIRFYEQHAVWLTKQYGNPSSGNWPNIFYFARLVRNTLVHNGLHLRFSDPKAPKATWRNLHYDSSSDGRKILEDDLEAGDLLMLLMEFGTALDKEGAPAPE